MFQRVLTNNQRGNKIVDGFSQCGAIIWFQIVRLCACMCRDCAHASWNHSERNEPAATLDPSINLKLRATQTLSMESDCFEEVISRQMCPKSNTISHAQILFISRPVCRGEATAINFSEFCISKSPSQDKKVFVLLGCSQILRLLDDAILPQGHHQTDPHRDICNVKTCVLYNLQFQLENCIWLSKRSPWAAFEWKLSSFPHE